MRSLACILPLAIAPSLALASCGGGQTRGTPFDPEWADDRGAAMAEFERGFRGTRAPIGTDVAVGVIGKTALVGVPLGGGAPWTFTHELHGRPTVAGSVVVAVGAGEIFALDAKTGKLLWTRVSGGRLRGAGDDGVTTVVSLLPTVGYGSLVLVVARDGRVVRQLEDTGAIGVPAVVGDAVFLPWQGKFLSIYDMLTGEERGRVALRDPASRAFALGGSIFVGERSVVRFDERLARGAAPIALPAPMGGMPGDPVWMRPGTEWVNREADTSDKVRLHARPAASGDGVDGGRFAATAYRVAMGFDARSGALAWARVSDGDFLGGAAYAGGFALCDAGGAVTLFDGSSGEVVKSFALGKPVDACVVQTDGLAVARGGKARPLADQVADVLRTLDAKPRAEERALRDKLAESAKGAPRAAAP